MDYIKQWILKNKKLFVLLFIVFSAIVVGSIVRCSFIQGAKESTELSGIDQEFYTDLTYSQQSIFNGYSTKENELISFLTNSKWVDNTGTKVLLFRDSYFIERANESEISESYVICAIDDEKTKISSAHYQTIDRLTVLNAKGEYYNVILTKVTDSDNSNAGLVSANIESEKLFKNVKVYNRSSNVDNFSIENWNENANQFVEGKYDELYNILKDYCSKYYPQVASVSWANLVTIDYQSHVITFPFNVKLNNYYTINVTYSQDTGQFECLKTKTTS